MHLRTLTKNVPAKADTFSPVVSKIQEVVSLLDSVAVAASDTKAAITAFGG